MKDEKEKNYLESCIINNCGEPGCNDYSLKQDIIGKIIDGQANEHEVKLYQEIINNCINCKCSQYCEQELAIKNILVSKLDRKRVPLDVVEKIRSEIQKIS